MTASCLLSGCGVSAWLAEWPPGPEPAAMALPASDLELSRQAFNRGNYGIAISHLQSELAQYPASIAALNGLGASYDKLGRYEVAQRYYFRALELAPRSPLTLNNIAYSCFLQGRHDEAARYLALARQYDGSNPEETDQVATVAIARAAAEAVLQADTAIVPAHANAALPRANIVTVSQMPAGVIAQADAGNVPQADRAGNSQADAATEAVSLVRLDAGSRIEVSNGNGVTGMAARYRGFLQQQGGQVVRLTNADNYAYTRSTVYFRRGHRAAAEALVASLPLGSINIIESTDLIERVDVRLLIGEDMLAVTTQDFPGVALAQNIR